MVYACPSKGLCVTAHILPQFNIVFVGEWKPLLAAIIFQSITTITFFLLKYIGGGDGRKIIHWRSRLI